MNRLFSGTIWDRPPHCERCDKPESECQCPPLPAVAPVRKPPEKQTATLSVEKRKQGKIVTIVRGLLAGENDLAALLTQLKNRCGSGGRLDGDELELQGDQREKARSCLTGIGYRVKG